MQVETPGSDDSREARQPEPGEGADLNPRKHQKTGGHETLDQSRAEIGLTQGQSDRDPDHQHRDLQLRQADSARIHMTAQESGQEEHDPELGQLRGLKPHRPHDDPALATVDDRPERQHRCEQDHTHDEDRNRHPLQRAIVRQQRYEQGHQPQTDPAELPDRGRWNPITDAGCRRDQIYDPDQRQRERKRQ